MRFYILLVLNVLAIECLNADVAQGATVLTYEDVTYKLGKPDQETPAGDTGLTLIYKRGRCTLTYTTQNDVVVKQSKSCK